jgi:hypothetical protein
MKWPDQVACVTGRRRHPRGAVRCRCGSGAFIASGGWLVFGLFPPQPDPLGEALRALRTVRCGGYPSKVTEVEERLKVSFWHF